MKIRAAAKINLYLRVVGKRADGYHLLDTIIAPVSLYDEIEIKKLRQVRSKKKPSARITISCDRASIPLGKKNLVYRAAQRILDHCGAAESLHIHIRKRIPVGAGLGGGSTDAAATLAGVNRLLRLGLSGRQLERLGSRIGADVPFFIHSRPARARGIGDRLTPLKGFPQLWAVILYPNFSVSTAWVYRNLKQKLTKSMPNIKVPLKSNSEINQLLRNDLETVTIGKYPEIESLKSELLQVGASGALMSGSGSSVFGIFDSRQKAKTAFDRLQRGREFEAFLVRTLN